MSKKVKMSSGLSSGTVIGSNTINTTSNVTPIYGNGHGSLGSSIQVQKTTYVILGEEYETNGYYSDPTIGLTIATLNVLGKPFWIELKKQNFTFGYEMDAFIEERIKILDRDKKIDDLLS